MSELEFTGKTIEEAKKNAVQSLGVPEEHIEFTVINKGSPGILGLRSREVKIKAKLKEPPQIVETNEAKIAKQVLQDIISLLGLNAKIKYFPGINNKQFSLHLEGEDLGALIGRRGQTLTALQYLVRLIVSEKIKSWISINIDVAGYKKKRYESLRKLALRLAEHVKTTKRSINLEPMPPDERRIIHLTLANHSDVTTHSIDEGEKRKVVIQYKKH